jgi:signal transduction histidine kinase
MLLAGIAGNLNAEQNEFVETIRQKGEQLLELIKGLLDLSKLESGTLSLNKGDVEVRRLLADVAETLRPMAVRKGVRLTVESGAAVPALWGDVGRLRQVFVNLGENAVKFTPTGGSVTLGARRVRVPRAAPSASTPAVLLGSTVPAIELRVADTGIGVPESERERVFDSFYQVDSSSTRSQAGAGLGLAIVRRLVEAHDGTIRIESNEPRGTMVAATFPVRGSGA